MAENKRGNAELTRENIDLLRGDVHTYDSFGRAFVDGVFTEALKQLERRPVEQIELQLPITVRPISSDLTGVKVCVTVCVSVGDKEVCIQVCTGED